MSRPCAKSSCRTDAGRRQLLNTEDDHNAIGNLSQDARRLGYCRVGRRRKLVVGTGSDFDPPATGTCR